MRERRARRTEATCALARDDRVPWVARNVVVRAHPWNQFIREILIEARAVAELPRARCATAIVDQQRDHRRRLLLRTERVEHPWQRLVLQGIGAVECNQQIVRTLR